MQLKVERSTVSTLLWSECVNILIVILTVTRMYNLLSVELVAAVKDILMVL